MSNQKTTTLAIQKVCPICQIKYQTSDEKPTPTCGMPDCIREARARGLPFVAVRSTTITTPKKPRKRAKAKAS